MTVVTTTHPAPSLDGAFHRGREAFYAGKPATECPWPSGTPLAARWHTGWQYGAALRASLDYLYAREA